MNAACGPAAGCPGVEHAPDRDRAGFALLATLWLVVAIGVVGLEWGLRAQDQRRVALNVVDAATARAAAESGIAQARARLEEALRRAQELGAESPRPLLDPWREPARLVPDSIGGGNGVAWRVHMEDAGTRLDLNRAEPEELRRLLVALRVDAGRADRVSQSVADWRDPDDAHRARGAEREWYERAGRPVLPRNGPFQDVTELRHVRDVTDQLYERVAPFLTVRGTGRVNVMAAPRPVLLALPGLGEEAVRALERRRRAGRPLPNIASLGDELSPPARRRLSGALSQLFVRTTTETREVVITSEGSVEGSSVRVRAQALVVRSRDAAFLVRLEVTP